MLFTNHYTVTQLAFKSFGYFLMIYLVASVVTLLITLKCVRVLLPGRQNFFQNEITGLEWNYANSWNRE